MSIVHNDCYPYESFCDKCLKDGPHSNSEEGICEILKELGWGGSWPGRALCEDCVTKEDYNV